MKTIALILLFAAAMPAYAADPMHDFERCMDALGNMKLPPAFPAGEFCAEFSEQRHADLGQIRRSVEEALADGRKAFDLVVGRRLPITNRW